MVAGRPAIPAEIMREILIESGHRCAVCGEPCPLERAHIIPWRQSKTHRAQDLVCLCSNCHQRAEGEKWGEKTLRVYKEKPWVIRARQIGEKMPNTSTVTFRIEGVCIDMADDRKKHFLKCSMAGYLGIPPETIEVIATEAGSTIVTLHCPIDAGDRLMEAILGKDTRLQATLTDIAEQCKLYDYNVEKLKALLAEGKNYDSAGDLDSAESSFRASLALAKGLKEHKLFASASCNLALILEKRGDLLEACSLHQDALIADQLIGNDEGNANHFFNLGRINAGLGREQVAQTFFEEALRLYEKLGKHEYANLVRSRMQSDFDS